MNNDNVQQTGWAENSIRSCSDQHSGLKCRLRKGHYIYGEHSVFFRAGQPSSSKLLRQNGSFQD